MHTKSNVFNVQLKYPNLKYVYDEVKYSTETLKDSIPRAKQRLNRFEQFSMQESEDEDNMKNLEDSPEKKKEFMEQLKQTQKMIDLATQEMADGMRKTMENFEGNEFVNPDGSIKNAPKLKEEKWVEREENEELKEFFEKGDKEWMKSFQDNMKEGETIINMQPFSKQKEEQEGEEAEGIQGAGVYHMKDGKLVKGEGRKREEVMFSNWYCSNADPEDLRRHRELMDRFTFKGPKWDGVDIPKSIIEEEAPVYRRVEKEEHPSTAPQSEETWGEKKYETIVR